MRDAQIYAQNEQNARRQAALYNQVAFVNNRMVATEKAILLLTLWQRVRCFFDPAYFIGLVDAVHLRMDAEQKAKAKEAAGKPRLTVVGVNRHAH